MCLCLCSFNVSKVLLLCFSPFYSISMFFKVFTVQHLVTLALERRFVNTLNWTKLASYVPLVGVCDKCQCTSHTSGLAPSFPPFYYRSVWSLQRVHLPHHTDHVFVPIHVALFSSQLHRAAPSLLLVSGLCGKNENKALELCQGSNICICCCYCCCWKPEKCV